MIVNGVVKIVWVLILGSWLLALTSCQRTKPQMPSNRAQEVDSTELRVALLAQRLVEEANTTLAHYVQGLDSAYVLELMGYWHRVPHRLEGVKLQKNEKVLLHSKIYTLDGDLLSDAEEVITVGKREVPTAVDKMLEQMRTGECASLLIPWYAAFGAAGNGIVPAYENVRIEIEVTEYDE